MADIYYRTKDGRADYGFSFVRQDGGHYRIYIDQQPSYGSRATDSHSTHRISAGNNRYYICWQGSISSEEEARQVAATWADKTQEYIRSGRRF